MSEQTFIIIACTSTYGVLLCVKFNKQNTMDGFEGLQGLWTGGGEISWSLGDREFDRLLGEIKVNEDGICCSEPVI